MADGFRFLYGEQWGTVLLVSFLLTWGIGLAPPLLIRFAIVRRTISKGWAIGIVVLFWVFNVILFTALGSKSKTHFAFTLVACVSFVILTKGAKKQATPAAATGQTHVSHPVDAAKRNESSGNPRGASPKMNSNKISDMAPDQPRFSRSAGGVITDSHTNLQWLPGPDQDTDYQQAEEWLASQIMAGGGWRMPTRQELKTLYAPSCEFHIPLSFKATDMRWVWAEPHDATTAWDFNFDDGGENVDDRNISGDVRVFAVRADPRSLPSYGSFSVDSDGVITDSATNLQWLPGPEQNINYSQAEEWVVSQTRAGGGWRMPTQEDLKTLYDPSSKYHISPLFKATAKRWIWAELRNSSSAWAFNFDSGNGGWCDRVNSGGNLGVFAVRERR